MSVRKIKICVNPMEIKNTCVCGYSKILKFNIDMECREKACPTCGKPTKLIME